MQKEGGNNPAVQIRKGYQLLLYRPVQEGELKVFEGLYQQALNESRSDPRKAVAMAGGRGEEGTPAGAALVVVANAMLNLDEVVTKN